MSHQTTRKPFSERLAEGREAPSDRPVYQDGNNRESFVVFLQRYPQRRRLQ